VLASVVAAGNLGHLGSGPATLAVPRASAVAQATTAAATGGAPAGPFVTPDPLAPGRLRASGPEPVAISVRPTAGGLSVSGNVLARAVTTLRIRVVDQVGADVAARSLSLEYPDAGAILPGDPTGFALLIGLSAPALASASFVEVDAYDSLGAMLGSALHLLGSPPPARCGAGWDDCTSA